MGSVPIQIGEALQPIGLRPLANQPLISILMANFNYQQYISQSIESALSQSYSNWELVICDDGSTDQSLAIIQKYSERDHRIRLICQPNGGHTSALNRAFAACCGEVICFLDSDDLFLPDKLDTVLKAFAGNPTAGFITHRVIRVNDRRNRMGVWPMPDMPDGWLAPELLAGGGVLPYAPPTSGICLRRELADLLFPISTLPPLHMCPDQVITRLAPLVSGIRRMPEALSEMRIHSSNTYSQQEVSAEAVSRQLQLSSALWREQKRFLKAIDPELAARLTTIDDSSFTALLQYLEAKLRRDPTVGEKHKKFLAVSRRAGESKGLTFWKWSVYLPNFVFRPAVRVFTGQGALKQLIARLRQLA